MSLVERKVFFEFEIPQGSRLQKLVKKLASQAESFVVKRISNGIPPAISPLTAAVRGSGKPLQDTGALMASIHSGADSKGGFVATSHEAAAVNHFGATIKPKRAKKLWIPASAETRRLMRRYSPTPSGLIKALKAAGYRLWTSKSGKAFMAQAPREKQPFVLFVLRSSVEIPARPFLYLDDLQHETIRVIWRNECLKSQKGSRKP